MCCEIPVILSSVLHFIYILSLLRGQDFWDNEHDAGDRESHLALVPILKRMFLGQECSILMLLAFWDG